MGHNNLSYLISHMKRSGRDLVGVVSLIKGKAKDLKRVQIKRQMALKTQKRANKKANYLKDPEEGK